ncbi:hypothetical protein OG698_02360 [Streptomyces sp. NBC_01003]|nr:hypothetical protein OG698_02360 [Streptomyces sp. NBC_01003]
MTLGKALARAALTNGVRGPVTVKGMDKTLTQCNGEPILDEARR